MEGRYYQYTAIDEYTRKRVLWASKEVSTLASTEFIKVMVKKFPFKIECIQTDNGTEFTNRFNPQRTRNKTMFEKRLEEMGIRHKLIKPKTPRHNGKVERQHRIDEERFYKHMRMYSLEDGRKQLRVYQRKSNNYIKTCLGMKSPNTIVRNYQGVMF